MWSTVKWTVFPWEEWCTKISKKTAGWYDDGMLVRCLYWSHLRFNCFHLKIRGISLSLRMKNIVIMSWWQILSRCLLSERCSTHWDMYSAGKSFLCCSVSLFLIILSLKPRFWSKAGTKRKAAGPGCVLPGISRSKSSVLLAQLCRSSLWGGSFVIDCPLLRTPLCHTGRASHYSWDAMGRTGDMGQ